jgi:hypothetical protein
VPPCEFTDPIIRTELSRGGIRKYLQDRGIGVKDFPKVQYAEPQAFSVITATIVNRWFLMKREQIFT